MPVVRVDSEVYRWLQSRAVAFEDSPNSVLRRVAGLKNTSHASESGSPFALPGSTTTPGNEAPGRVTGEDLRKKWGVKAVHALYHRDGTFYENLERFPGALFDPSGYVIFKTQASYQSDPRLRIGQKLNVPGGIATLPGYVRAEK